MNQNIMGASEGQRLYEERSRKMTGNKKMQAGRKMG